MNNLLLSLKIHVNDKIYVKDPETSSLGRKIIQESILLMDEIGFENFTFKKLGERIGSNESSIYRYFESKHKLLVYLSSWYWSWIEYRLVFETNNIENPNDKLNKLLIVGSPETQGILDLSMIYYENPGVITKTIPENSVLDSNNISKNIK